MDNKKLRGSRMSSNNNTPPKSAFGAIQLSLWQNFLHNGEVDKEKLSNTIELWDAAPKYFMDRTQQTKIRENGYLPSMKRPFTFKNKDFIVTISPARVFDRKKGREVEYYPSPREEIVEDALRKLALKEGCGFIDNSRSGVTFSLHQLKKELSTHGHTMSYAQVTESLDILSSCKIEIIPINGKALCKTSPITSLVGVSKKDLKRDPNSRWIVDFSVLVTKAINTLSYRQFNYDLMMSHKSHLSRYLHKRLAHNFLQAGLGKAYTVKLSTIARDSCLLNCARANDNKRKMDQALQELVDNHVLMCFEEVKEDEKRGPRNALIDVTYNIYAHIDFISEVKRANKRANTELLTDFEPQMDEKVL